MQMNLWVLSVTNTTTLRNWTDLMSAKPFPRMMRMEAVVTINTENNKPSHYLSFGKFAVFCSCLCRHARLGHWIRGSQPERADTTSGHMSSAAWTDSP